MAWNDLATNQMVSYTDATSGATTGVFTLNPGQANVTSNQCMTKLDAQTKYNLNASNLSTYANNQLVPKIDWVTGINPGFGSGFGPANAVLYSIEVLPDDKLVIGGVFSSYQGVPFGNIVRLNPDGSIDTSFVTGIGFPITGGYVKTTTTLPDGTMYVGGSFTAYNGTPANGIIKLLANGSIDTSFAYGTGFNVPSPDVSSIKVQPADGKIIVAGGFITYQGSSYPRIIRLNPTGTIDTTFLVGSGFPFNSVISLLLRANGSIIATGNWNTYKGTSANSVVGIASNGGIYSPFVYGTGFDGGSFITTDGTNLFFGGSFTTYQGVSSNFAIKLNQFGTKDTSFNIGTGFNNTVFVLYPQTDGNVFAAGYFTAYQGTTVGRVIRLTATGTKDTTFNAGGTGFNASVQGMVRQSIGANAGKYVMIGSFTTYNGVSSPQIIRLNVNGTKDI